MAKSGIYLNGRELLECELDKLDGNTRQLATDQTLAEIKLENKIILGANKVALGILEKLGESLK